MNDLGELRRENESLRERNEQLARQLAEAEQAIVAFARGEVDAVALDASAPPVLLRVAQEDLRRSEAQYRRIVESTSEGVWMYDPEGATTFMNERMASMLGIPVEEAVGQPIFAFLEASEHAAARARLASRRPEAPTGQHDSRVRRRDGATLFVSVRASSLFDAAGHLEAVLCLVTDVSAQRLADETRARLAAIVESSEDAIVSAGLDGLMTSWNLGAEKLYGYSAAEMLGESISRLMPAGGSSDEATRIFERVLRGDALRQHETTRRRKDGSLVEVALTASPIRDALGALIGASMIARDLTARRQAEATLLRTEEQFRRAQKMEAVGRLAGGVAHDFNNLLSVILSYTDLTLDELRQGDPLRADLEEVRKAAQRATDLTRQLLAFSRQQVLKPRVIDLDETFTAMERMLGRLLGEDIELFWLTAPGLGRVLADPGQLEQVVMNLAVNARDAMPDGGKLTIEATNVELDASYAGVVLGGRPGIAPGEYVMLAVSDTGIGMDAATRDRIFEPFFTTKEVGKGTGLGLATVFGIVQQSGGHIGVYSEPGHGTTFKIYLPRTDRAADAPGTPAASAMLRGTETILLVEDEPQLRVVAHAILRRQGYKVLETSNGGEAFLLAKDFPAEIQLLLTDVVMPRMSGRKLAEALGADRPAMKVLFVSGYTDDAIVHHGVLNAGVAFLQKPFTPTALLRRVREVLDAAPGLPLTGRAPPLPR